MFVASHKTTEAASPLPFDTVLVNSGSKWDRSTNKFTMTAITGLYFISLSVGVRGGIPVKYSLRNTTGEIASITRTSTAHPGTDTTNRDLIVGLSAPDSVYVSSRYQTYSDSYYYTSLSLFSICGTMKEPPVAFSVARDSPTYGFLDPVTFNVQLVNEGSHYGSNHRFTAPLDGIYYFSISVGLSSRRTANFTLYKNNKPLANIVRLSTAHNGSDTLSRSIMTSLKKDDTIHVVNQENRDVWSSSSLETSFTGFLYEPANGYPV